MLAYVTAGYGDLGDQLTICPVLFDPSKSSRRRVPPRSLQSIEYSAPTAALGALISYGQVMLHGQSTLGEGSIRELQANDCCRTHAR